MIQESVVLTNATDFISNLKEVQVLLSAADSHEHSEIEYAAFNKSALLLLTSKFENFLESIAEDYIACINSLQPCSNLIPIELRLQHTFKMLASIENYKLKHKKSDAVDTFTKLGELWISDISYSNLDIDCKFSYGKHGEAELNKLFSGIGIDNIFEKVKVIKQQETILEEKDDTIKSDFKSIFNSVNGIRNNILHQDASPTLTTRTVCDYKEDFELFAGELEKFLNSELSNLLDACTENGT
jgi:RiboL-PSP-HEPN